MTHDPYDVVVLGEALIDVVHTSAGAAERPGGSPANVAVALGRLGRSVALATRVADDAGGRSIRSWLADAKVETIALGAPARTSTALARIDDAGDATYEFDLDWAVPADAQVPGARLVHTGSVATTLSPGADAVASLIERARVEAIVTYDPNIRPALTGGREDALRRVERLVALADVAKASADDLAWLYPDATTEEVARRWCEVHPALVVVTDGAAGALAVGRAGAVRVPATTTTILDTVGAGDTFMGTLIDTLLHFGGAASALRARLQQLTTDDVTAALRRSAAAAAITVSRRGMDPPTRTELALRSAEMKESA
ncbi:carbohydrate kinase family protein [Microbacterium sp. RD1]|uniref:carbohydrate kinase family protein n=1 Tax=Microbacterium sp. RD1 TaxID=3457313 RepID=UPI003FA60C69